MACTHTPTQLWHVHAHTIIKKTKQNNQACSASGRYPNATLAIFFVPNHHHKVTSHLPCEVLDWCQQPFSLRRIPRKCRTEPSSKERNLQRVKTPGLPFNLQELSPDLYSVQRSINPVCLSLPAIWLLTSSWVITESQSPQPRKKRGSLWESAAVELFFVGFCFRDSISLRSPGCPTALNFSGSLVLWRLPCPFCSSFTAELKN